MREDLDRLMEEKGIDWALVFGSPKDTAEIHYLTNGARITHGYVVKNRGHDPILIHGSMERDEAATSGLPLKSFTTLGLAELRKESENPFDLKRLLLHRIFDELEIRGRVGVYGRGALHRFLPLVRRLFEERSGVELIEDAVEDIFTTARMTKDRTEVDAIRSVGARTEEVVLAVKDRLRAAERKDGLLHEKDGPLTIGAIHRMIQLELARRSLNPADGTIFAQGHDAGVPHSRGTEADPIRVGVPIVFDIFPRERGGGYFYDMTRTLSVGRPSDEAIEIYDAVLRAQEMALASITPGMLARDLDELVCQAFEEDGYPTARSSPSTETGYVHSLGHGIGLDIHERPGIRCTTAAPDRLEPGMVFTIEPGLYFPEKEIGVRIEDTVWLDPDGQLEVLTRTDKEFIL